MILDIIPNDKSEVLRVGYIYNGEKKILDIACKGDWYNLCVDTAGCMSPNMNGFPESPKKNKKKPVPYMTHPNWDGRKLYKVWEGKLCRNRMYDIIWDQPEDTLNQLLSASPYRICFCDIETDISDEGFASPDNPTMPITTISLMIDKYVLVIGTRALITPDDPGIAVADIKQRIREYTGDEDIEFSYIVCPSELDMLEKFMNILRTSVDVLTGWNFTGFDWAYITNRLKVLLKTVKERDAFVAKGSIMGEVVNMQSASSFSQGKTYSVRPAQLFICDYMDLISTFPPTNLPSYSLDSIAETYCGIKKVSYEGSLRDLYINDYNTYVMYNAIDSVLVSKIHAKKKSLSLGLYQAIVAKCSITHIMSKTALAERLMAWEFRLRGFRLAGMPRKNIQKDEQYEGAYVKEPIPGLYKTILGCDFASLYPSIARAFNISPDTFVCKLGENDANREKALRESKDFIVTTNKSVFRKEKGCLPVIMANIFSERKAKKKQSFAAMSAAHNLADILQHPDKYTEEEVDEALSNAKALLGEDGD